ncbi:venom protease-like isoform X2 [Leguminivora glycinivorella]|uniref:venom protease-like isoform X2 n=1 Tax=Leguminivora glycinivorella TaxID=1035111 RepID=UPI002010740B|nr:venom protease-like isoform X2 [Leguminivora glycinivorella]
MFVLKVLFILTLGHKVITQRNVGDQCVDQYTNTVGRCAPAQQCESARQDFQQNGIRPTFCSQSFDSAIVCCRDGNNIFQTAPPQVVQKNGDRPVWGTSGASNGQTDRRRVSQRKCEEYSKSVVQTFSFLPLVPEPETVSISAPKCDYVKVELIVGGENAQLGEFPHMAAIGWVNFEDSYSFNCGGSLISTRWVLTAGHCTRDPRARDPNPAIVRLGDQNIDPSVQDGATPVEVPIKQIVKHPEYKPPRRYNDIALLELATDVDFSNTIRPACLWQRNDFDSYTRAVATGWGVIDVNTKETSKELQKVSISLLENDYCDQLLANSRNRNWQGFAPSQMCAGELRGGRDTCQGDSGAPLQVASRDNQCIFHVVGVTSFGAQCARSGRPAIYTRVASYLDWIESVVWPNQ